MKECRFPPVSDGSVNALLATLLLPTTLLRLLLPTTLLRLLLPTTILLPGLLAKHRRLPPVLPVYQVLSSAHSFVPVEETDPINAASYDEAGLSRAGLNSIVAVCL